jgi:ketosteroid isomerase-like protein
MRIALAAILLLLAACALSGAPGSQPGAASRETRRAESPAVQREREVRARSAALARASGNVEQSLAFFTSTAAMHVEGAPSLRGHAEIGEWYRAFFTTLVSFWNETHEVRVAESGELAYEIGTSRITAQELELQKLGIKQSASRYLAIWTRGKDGEWRIDVISITNNP